MGLSERTLRRDLTSRFMDYKVDYSLKSPTMDGPRERIDRSFGPASEPVVSPFRMAHKASSQLWESLQAAHQRRRYSTLGSRPSLPSTSSSISSESDSADQLEKLSDTLEACVLASDPSSGGNDS